MPSTASNRCSNPERHFAFPLCLCVSKNSHRSTRLSCADFGNTEAQSSQRQLSIIECPAPPTPCLCDSVFQIPPWRTNLAGKLFVMRPTLPIRKTSTIGMARPGHFEFLRNSGNSRFKRYTMYSIRIHSNLSSTTLGSSRPVTLQPNRSKFENCRSLKLVFPVLARDLRVVKGTYPKRPVAAVVWRPSPNPLNDNRQRTL